MTGVNAGFISCGYNEDCLTCEHDTCTKITLQLKRKIEAISFVLFLNW